MIGLSLLVSRKYFLSLSAGLAILFAVIGHFSSFTTYTLVMIFNPLLIEFALGFLLYSLYSRSVLPPVAISLLALSVFLILLDFHLSI